MPFFTNLTQFKELFYFGDEWDLPSQIADSGLFRWAMVPFAENLVPLFKILWGWAVIAFNGSYLWLLLLLWLTHFMIMASFGTILRSLGFSAFAITFSLFTCGWAWSNIESLAWSVQWSPMLAMLLFMLAWRLLIHILHRRNVDRWSALQIGLYGLLLLGSALSFSRGVLSGLVLGSYAAFGSRSNAPPVVRRTTLVISVLISVLLGLVIYAPRSASSHAQPLGSHIDGVLAFGVQCLTLNPLFQIASWAPVHLSWQVVLLFGFFKLTVVLAGFSAARNYRERRAAFVLLILFDVLNCCLLGIGRYNTGVQASVSSRYQYISLVCLAPFLGAIVQRALLPDPPGKLDKLATTILLLAWCALLTYRWPGELKVWAVWRGTQTRTALRAAVRPQERFAQSLINSNRAAQLRTRFNLH